MKNRGFVVLLLLSGSMVFAASMRVQVRKSMIRATPSQLGRVVDTVTYGTTLQTGKQQKGWVSVTTAKGQMGWLHGSALSQKPIAMQAGSKDVA
ncbi:SH3 domain-containing protein, partial [Planctomycetota bacterium]